ncbi:hypothetical protein H8F21_14175 [Pseudomonas sp. P66]|uniref:Uncharacterized protein n=1 Tax=Pseudomonas arcuscaelestis TaxID=2710591 RepID=A0ABS2BYL0_9PSED|nr:hypothetical protein [Pseudomonas arcuscaelestis]MBM5458711.1 hypothetical protein [Pseudomonas arcuscaelestis]
MSSRIESKPVTGLSTAQEDNTLKNWESWDRTIGRPVSGWIDVRYIDGKEFLNKRAEDCYWGADSLIGSWRKAK